jgi:hypothetical protein
MKLRPATITGIIIAPIFAMLGIQYVAAQTATTSDSTASSTVIDASSTDTLTATETLEVATTTSLVASTTLETSDTASSTAATGTSTVETATTTPSIQVSTSTSEASSTSSAPVLPDFTAATSCDAIIAGVESLEDAYYSQNSTYFQILPGNALPTYESGTVASNLGEDIPGNVQVDIYDAPSGQGYQVTFQQDGTEYSTGEGPESADRSFTQVLPVAAAATSTLSAISATSTVAIDNPSASSTEALAATSTIPTASSTTPTLTASSTIDLSTSSTTPDVAFGGCWSVRPPQKTVRRTG